MTILNYGLQFMHHLYDYRQSRLLWSVGILGPLTKNELQITLQSKGRIFSAQLLFIFSIDPVASC